MAKFSLRDFVAILSICSRQDRHCQALIFNSLVSTLDLTGPNMPTYYSKRTTVQLSLVDLENTTTTYPDIYPGRDSERVFSIHATEFARGSVSGTLKELPVSKEDAHSNMSYLGLNQNMPFFMVHAGVDLYDQTHDKTHIRRPERVPKTEGTAPFISHSLACSVSGRTLPGNTNDHIADPESEIQGQQKIFGAGFVHILCTCS